MVIETDHREEDRNEARMDASSTLAGSTLGRRKGHDYLKRRFECSYRSERSTQLSRHLRCDAPGLPIFFGAIAKLVRQRTANPLSLVRIQVAPLGL